MRYIPIEPKCKIFIPAHFPFDRLKIVSKITKKSKVYSRIFIFYKLAKFEFLWLIVVLIGLVCRWKKGEGRGLDLGEAQSGPGDS